MARPMQINHYLFIKFLSISNPFNIKWIRQFFELVERKLWDILEFSIEGEIFEREMLWSEFPMNQDIVLIIAKKYIALIVVPIFL